MERDDGRLRGFVARPPRTGAKGAWEPRDPSAATSWPRSLLGWARGARGPLALAVLVIAALLVWLVAAPLLSWNGIGAQLVVWRATVAATPLLAGALYVAAYAVVVALSLPAGGALSVLGGALFGAAAGGALAVLAATLGAVMLFLLARGALGAWLVRPARPLVERLRPAIERDGFAGLLALRLIPVVPFWLTNLAPALLGMRLLPYVGATLLGILPATFVLAGIGGGAADVLARGQAPDLSALVSPPVLLPMLGLAALSLAPALWRRWRARDA